MKTNIPCPKCLETGFQHPCYFNKTYVKGIKQLEVKCKKCNFITWAKFPTEEDKDALSNS